MGSCISLVPRLSPCKTITKSREGDWYLFARDVLAHRRHSYNELICYITTRACWLLWSNRLIERIIPMVTTAEEVTRWYSQPGISVQFNTSYRMQLSDYLVMKICPHKLMSTIYCIAWSFFLLQQAKTCNSQEYRVTELLLCSLHVMSKLTYWYRRRKVKSGRSWYPFSHVATEQTSWIYRLTGAITKIVPVLTILCRGGFLL